MKNTRVKMPALYPSVKSLILSEGCSQEEAEKRVLAKQMLYNAQLPSVVIPTKVETVPEHAERWILEADLAWPDSLPSTLLWSLVRAYGQKGVLHVYPRTKLSQVICDKAHVPFSSKDDVVKDVVGEPDEESLSLVLLHSPSPGLVDRYRLHEEGDGYDVQPSELDLAQEPVPFTHDILDDFEYVPEACTIALVCGWGRRPNGGLFRQAPFFRDALRRGPWRLERHVELAIDTRPCPQMHEALRLRDLIICRHRALKGGA